jgi:hypothetical protein
MGAIEMRRVVIGFLLIVSLLLATAGSGVGLAEEPVSAPTLYEQKCMQEVAGFGLVCSANDIQLAKATGIEILDKCDYPGDEVTFTATFEVVLTAQARHDIGIYFAADGDPNSDGALTGLCSISTLPWSPDPPWLDLDGTLDNLPGTKTVSNLQDVCGDINGSHNPLFPKITITTKCIDTNGNGKLNLPYCTSWRQSGANEYCASPLSAYPGAPSKCNCDTGFEVDILVPSATILVKKTADKAQVDEPGAYVTFSVYVENTGSDPSNKVTLDTLEDTVYGDITSVHDLITFTDCKTNVPFAPGPANAYKCSFTAWVGGDAGSEHKDTVEAEGKDDRGNGVEGQDDATVTLTDVAPTSRVDKSAGTTSLPEPGGDVVFTVIVYNDSFEDVTLTSLVDDVFGDLNGQGDCVTGGTIAAGESYNCSFSGAVSGEPGDYTDTVESVITDNDSSTDTQTDDATVTLTDVAPTIAVDKSANPTSLPEPGGNVEFTVVVTNNSFEAVTLTSLTDDIYGDLNNKGTCVTGGNIAAGASYTCKFTGAVSGEPGGYTDTVTAVGTDNDGSSDTKTDDATVTLLDVAPTIRADKSADPTSIDEPGGDVVFTVIIYNDSFEAVTLTSLTDDVYGDLNGQGTCNTGGTIAAGASYTCAFTGAVSGDPGDYTDTITGVVTDNDGSTDTEKDEATVTILDVLPAAHITKTPTKVVVTFEVVIYNDSTASSDPLTVDDLNDSTYFDITTAGHHGIESTKCDLAIGQVIQPGESYSCSFTAEVTNPDHTNTVTADVSDDEGNGLQPSDSAWVDFESYPSGEARLLPRRLAV